MATIRMGAFDILMLTEGPPVIAQALAKRGALHEVWRAPDPAKALEAVAPQVRALAATFHGEPINAALMRRLPKLEIVSSFGVGYDHIDAKWAGEHGVIVTHTPGVLDDDVADIALALTINAVRRLPQAEAYLRAGGWLKSPYPLTASLRGRTMGILGLGRIGKAVAKRAEAFGLSVIYHGRKPQAGVGYRYCATLEDMARQCDILMICAPGGAGTHNIVNAEILRALGPQGVLINVARGSLVDEAALIAALKSQAILGAGLDVFADEPRVPAALIELDNAVLLPHVGSASHHTRRAMAQLVVDNLVSWIEGKGPLTPVPETPWAAKRL